MSAACERLLALQERQMALIEMGSTRLLDHIEYWGTVRGECALLYAARKAGLKNLGMTAVPALQVSAERAKEAIEMQLLLQELLQTPWGKDAWTLADCSSERFRSEPVGCFKKGPRLVEVIYDGDAQNRTWYTAWNLIFMRENKGWTFCTSGADEKGLYTMQEGTRTYYLLFSVDASLYSATGTWTVNDLQKTFSFQNSRDTTDGAAGHCEEPATGQPGEAGPAAAQPVPAGGSHTGPDSSGDSWNGGHRPRGECPNPVGSSEGVLVCTPPPSPVPSPLSVELESESQESEISPPSPDSSEAVTNKPSKRRKRSVGGVAGFDIFQGLLSHPCLILTGSSNQVKCLRFRLKGRHRTRFRHITTTWWTVGEEGSARCGSANILVTFDSVSQRSNFLATVSLPPGMTCRPFTAHVD